jgi:hypothetical protein
MVKNAIINFKKVPNSQRLIVVILLSLRHFSKSHSLRSVVVHVGLTLDAWIGYGRCVGFVFLRERFFVGN